MSRRVLLIVVLIALLVAGCAREPERSGAALDTHLDAGAAAVAELGDDSGEQAFEAFLLAVSESAATGDDRALAQALGRLERGRAPDRAQRSLASRLLRRYVVARYSEPLIRDVSEIVRFRTTHSEGRDNWDAPEFVRQREWLEGRATAVGLGFRSVDGRVEEITLGDGGRVLGMLTHGDVQGVEGQTWSLPPWEGRRDGDRIVGRGTEDDKGPIVTALYVFAALGDSGWLDGTSLRLMVANGEECCWDEIPYYLDRVEPPDVTLGFDAAYPVTHAQKAWAEIIVTTPRSEVVADETGWEIVAIEGGSGLSIIAESATVVLRPPESAGIAELTEEAERWAAAHPPARFEVTREGDLVRLRAWGLGGHSSEPESGHNAFGDLTAFLFDSSMPLSPPDQASLMRCMGRIIGTETRGERLGIAHTDPLMGELTVNLALFDEEDGNTRARASMRVPRGIEADTIEAAVDAAVAECARTWDHPLTGSFRMSGSPHFVPPDGPLVLTLLEVWEESISDRPAGCGTTGDTAPTNTSPWTSCGATRS